MGVVYEAVHEGVGGRAAIKILRVEIASNPAISERFFDEARAANSVEHPSIIRIFDSGQTEDGLCYLAMEFLDGETLAHRIKLLGRLSVASCIRLSRQVASALSAVHGRGVIHRDLKPENLMVVKDPESPGGERIKVLDFGIARLAEDLRTREGTTESGVVLGTPMYMSPEQCHGAKQVTAHSDVYSLGIIMYKMLAGQAPFVSLGMGALIAMHLTETPQRVETHNAAVPITLSDLISDMLAKSPGDRPSMSDVEKRLRGMSSTEDLPAPSSRSEIATRKLSIVDTPALLMGTLDALPKPKAAERNREQKTRILTPVAAPPAESPAQQQTGSQERASRLIRSLALFGRRGGRRAGSAGRTPGESISCGVCKDPASQRCTCQTACERSRRFCFGLLSGARVRCRVDSCRYSS
jgi:serine/threonine protein kinase